MYARRGWTKMYWDIVDQLYWAPQYVGMKSIPQKHWKVDGDKVTVPREMTNPSGPLYRRLRSTSEFWPYVQRQEETFNHIFDLTFAIAPGEAIAGVFGEFVPMGDSCDYQSHGRELGTRFGYNWQENITTTDGFFTSSDSVLAVELKFNAKTSRDQLAKYLMILAAEQIRSGNRDNLNLLYIFTNEPNRSFEQQTGVNINDINGSLFPALCAAPENKRVLEFYDQNERVLISTLERLSVTCITWGDLISSLRHYSGSLTESAGDRTLHRLLGGLIEEILLHPLSGVSH